MYIPELDSLVKQADRIMYDKNLGICIKIVPSEHPHICKIKTSDELGEGGVEGCIERSCVTNDTTIYELSYIDKSGRCCTEHFSTPNGLVGIIGMIMLW